MTNLEYLLTRESIDNNSTLCILAYMCKHKHSCMGVNCSYCEFVNDIELCVQTLLEEHKEAIKLTLHEKCILESIPDEYNYIARNENGKLYIYDGRPIKNAIAWFTYGVYCSLGLFEDMFKFIKWEDDYPYKIEDILKNCEVIENVD